MIVYQKLPQSPETAQRLSKAQQDLDGYAIGFHGSPGYAVGCTARNGFLASDNAERGHQFLETDKGAVGGVYVTPWKITADGYAIPHILFKDTSLPEDKQHWVRFVFQCTVHVDARR